VNKREVCRWYQVCPLKSFYERGLLDKRWLKEYCLVANPECIRKKMEDQGLSHPDNMLPDGNIDLNLK